MIACSDEIDAQGVQHITRLLKVHGCSRKATADRNRYGPFIVATSVDIASWAGRDQTRVFREEVQSLLRQRPAIFIGLSGQDFNLQTVWASALIAREYKPGDRTRLIFAASAKLTPPQRTLLTTVYGNSFPGHREEIERRALISMYGKPLLGGFFLCAIREKCALLLRSGHQDLPNSDIEETIKELDAFEARVCSAFDAEPEINQRWRNVARSVPDFTTHFLCIYRRQRLAPGPTDYEPLTIHNLGEMATDPGLSMQNLHLALFAIAVILMGQRLGGWLLEMVDLVGTEGQLRIRIGGRALKVFILAGSGIGAVRLENAGLINLIDAPNVVIVYPDQNAPPSRRRTPGRARVRRPAEIWLRDLVDSKAGIDRIVDMFKLELLAAR